MAAWVGENGTLHTLDVAVLEASVERCDRPLGQRSVPLGEIREVLYTLMWDKLGVVRNHEHMTQALGQLEALRTRLHETGVDDQTRACNVSWHDWLNLDSLITVSEAITRAALARAESCGAHFHDDYPGMITEESASFTTVRQCDGGLKTEHVPVRDIRLNPGESLLADEQSSSVSTIPVAGHNAK